MVRIPTHRPPTHPGEMLREEFLIPLGIPQKRAAELLSISYVRLNEVVLGKRGVTADTALRLARAFNTTPAFWLNLQLRWDLYHAMRAPEAASIAGIPVVNTKAAAGA